MVSKDIRLSVEQTHHYIKPKGTGTYKELLDELQLPPTTRIELVAFPANYVTPMVEGALIRVSYNEPSTND